MEKTGSSITDKSVSQADKVKEITDKLEQGIKDLFESEKYMNYLKVMSRFHNYSFNNSLLLAMQKPDATHVAGLQKWNKDFHRFVNKGEKGIAILAPMSFKSKELKEQPVKDSSGNQIYNADGSAKKKTVENEVATIGFKKVYVFDVSQTSGEPMPEYVHELNEAVEDEQVEAVINAVHDITGLSVDFEDIKSGAKGYYSYLKSVSSKNLSNYVKYIATREGTATV